MQFVWIGFFALILVLLAVDLGVFNRRSHVIEIKEATMWSVVWISLGLAFSGVVYLVYEYHWGGAGLGGGGVPVQHGEEAMWKYLTGYLIEKSLSVDNIFVMAMLFKYFKVPAAYQHKVLYWGIVGALFFRGLMIALGVFLIQQFDWIFYVFGAFLILTAIRMIFASDEEIDPEKSRIVRWARRLVPITDSYDGDKFRTRVGGRFSFTLLFLVVVIIEAMDVVFAVDSIPAIFAITTDPFLVMTSNVFAILGLRALYFVVASIMRQFRYMTVAVGLILILVGIKMLLHSVVEIAPEWSLLVICVVLAAGIIMSIVVNKREARTAGGIEAPAAAVQSSAATEVHDVPPPTKASVESP